MYTLSPVPMPTDTHYGFYAFLAVLLVIGGFELYYIALDIKRVREGRDSEAGLSGYLGLLALNAVLGFSALIVYHSSYNPVIPVNKPLVGVFDQFIVRVHVEQAGKNGTREVETQYMQLQLEGTGQYVLLPANAKRAYPKRMMLYWNPN